jgi:hypothetical protein
MGRKSGQYRVYARGRVKREEDLTVKCIFPTNSARWLTKVILLTINEEYEQTVEL